PPRAVDHIEDPVARAGVLALDLAAGLLLELLGEARIGVRRPLHHAQRTLASADTRGERARLRDTDKRHHERSDEADERKLPHANSFPHVSSLIVNSTSGCQASRTRLPSIPRTSDDETSRFCWSATRRPPSSSSTSKRVTAPR